MWKIYAFMAAVSCMLITPQSLQARPISYPGGWTVMAMNDGDSNSLHTHYTPDPRYSVGVLNQYWRDKEYVLNALQFNYLAKRWNGPGSQANLYLKSGVGVASGLDGELDGENSAAGFAGIAGDWETRRWFTSYENRYVDAGDLDNFYTQKARVGVAPYVGDYGDLHTWLMVEVAHKPEDDDPFTVTPLVRLFKGPVLTEAGMSLDGKVLFNFVYRF